MNDPDWGAVASRTRWDRADELGLDFFDDRLGVAPITPEQPAERQIVVDTALEQIPPPVYFERLAGVAPHRGFVRCPVHGDGDERTPSCQVFNEPARGWVCHSCRAGGTIFDLAAAVWGMGTRGQAFVELRRRLLAEFN